MTVRDREWRSGLLVLAVTALAATPGSAAGPAAKNGTTLAASKTIDICEVAEGTWRYSGEVSVWNEGAVDTIGLAIQDCIQNKTGPGQFHDAFCTNTFDPAVHEAAAGTTQPTADVYRYSMDAAPLDAFIRNIARVTILNHSGAIGHPRGPQPKASWTSEVQPCPVECGCVLTLGYWKTHLDAWPAGFNPQDPFYLSGDTWAGVLNTAPLGNGYYILAHQYIAAVLNQGNGACVPSGVQDILDLATAWIVVSTPASCPTASSCGLQKTWGGILDSYNNGDYPGGPPHCELAASR